MKLVLVESPAKTKSLSGYLGKDYTVMATYGHVRDLPSKTGSVKPDEDFEMIFDVVDRNKTHLANIAKAAKAADCVILATDPDREGEAISWHVTEHLKNKKINVPLQRISFNAITKNAVLEAVRNPRKLDDQLVQAYLARLGLDYLVGFTLSPILWRKLPGCRSAGRVQSVALRIICDREAEIEAFKSEEYWSIEGFFKSGDKNLSAFLKVLEGEKLEKMTLGSKEDAQNAVQKANATPYTVSDVLKKAVKRHPAAPFMTSTLQQEASRKLGMPPTVTMRLAQQLYEGAGMGEGLITYMRTDSISITPEAIQSLRKAVQSQYGKEYLEPSIRSYARKARNAQEAHEAIRPTTFTRTPDSLKGKIGDDLLKLYTLIWRRTLASQMASALFDQTTLTLKHPKTETLFKASGRVCTFDGFLKVYQEGTDDKDQDGDMKTLPAFATGETLDLVKIEPHQHFTEPPPRFSEASLIKALEEKGIGRPSTYARILQVLKDRSYVVLEKKQLHPKEQGRVVTAFLTRFFERYVQEDFTANMEESLDAISRGDQPWKGVLKDFWDPFFDTTQKAGTLKTVDVLAQIEKDLKDHLFKDIESTCPTCKEGQLHLRLGSFGPFLGCNRYPECKHIKSLTSGSDTDTDTDAPANAFPKELGTDPNLKESITLRRGPYGFYLQWGEGKKPKRVGLPKGLSIDEVTLEKACALGALPINLGPHPETGEEMIGGIGRFGPYVKYKDKFISVPDVTLLLEKQIHEIMPIIAKKLAAPSRRSPAKPKKKS